MSDSKKSTLLLPNISILRSISITFNKHLCKIHRITTLRILFSLFISTILFTSPSQASIGDMIKWQKREHILEKLPQNIFDEYTKNVQHADILQELFEYEYYAPDGEMHIYTSQYNNRIFCNIKNECLFLLYYKRYSDDQVSLYRLWLTGLQDNKPTLNHRSGNSRAFYFNAFIGSKKVMLTIYAQGQLEMQCY